MGNLSKTPTTTVANTTTPGASAFEKDKLYISYCAPIPKPKPEPDTNGLNLFQKVIRSVQQKMVFTEWRTTHVIVHFNDQIYDRSGPMAKLVTMPIEEYLKTNYNNFTITSFGTSDVNMVTRYKDLYDFVNKSSVKSIFSENTFTGEPFVVDNVQYKPNNTIYGVGMESVTTAIEAYKNRAAKSPINEAIAITQALDAMLAPKFLSSDKLKNPTYCSLTLGALIPALNGLTVLRYPALGHQLLSENYNAFNMTKIVTTIEIPETATSGK